MTIYFWVFVITLLIQFIPINKVFTYKKRVILTFLPLFLFGSLRKDFGFDYVTYESFFESVHTFDDFNSINERIELGYTYLNRLLPNFRSLLILTSAFTCGAYCYLFYKTIPVKYSWLAIVLLFLCGDKSIFFMFSGIRNAIAVSLLMLTVTFIRDRKKIYFILMLLIAFLFHTSALFFLPIAFIIATDKPLSQKEYIIWILVLFILLVIPLDRIIDTLTPFISIYFDRYTSYVDRADSLGDTRTILVLSSVTFMTIVILYYMRTCNLNRMNNVIARLSLLFVYSYLLGSLNVRTSQYFVPFFVVASTNLLANWEVKITKYIYLLFILVFLGYAFFVVYLGNPMFPYKEYYSVFSD